MERSQITVTLEHSELGQEVFNKNRFLQFFADFSLILLASYHVLFSRCNLW